MKHIKRFNENTNKYDIIDSTNYKKIKKKVTDYYLMHPKDFDKGFFTKEYFNTIIDRLSLNNTENKEILDVLKDDLMDILN